MSSDIIKRLKNAWVTLPISVRKSAAESAVAQLFWQSLGKWWKTYISHVMRRRNSRTTASKHSDNSVNTNRQMKNREQEYILNDTSHLMKTRIDLVTVLEAILTSRKPREKLLCLYENLMSNNFRKTAVLKKKNEL